MNAAGLSRVAVLALIWGSGFLPTVYQGVQCRSSGDPVLYVSNPPGMSSEIAAFWNKTLVAAVQLPLVVQRLKEKARTEHDLENSREEQAAFDDLAARRFLDRRNQSSS